MKQTWVEPHNQAELEPLIKGYESAIKSGAGAIFLAVCRGKVRMQSYLR